VAVDTGRNLRRDAEVRATYRDVFAPAEARVLFGVVLIYGLGFQFEILGLSILVYTRTGSPLLSALAFGIGFLPQVVGGALLISLADRLPPRPVIAVSLVVRALPGLVIGLAPALPVGAMLAVVAAAAVVAPVFTAGTAGLLPDLLPGESYVLGRSVFTIVNSGTQILGLGIAGGVLAVISARHLLVVAGAMLVTAALVVRVGLKRREPRHGSRSGGLLKGSLAGNAWLLADRRVRGLLLAQWVPAWLVTGAESLIVPYVASTGRPPSTASAMLAALPVGMLAGNLVLGRMVGSRMRDRLTFPLAGAMGLPLLGLAAQPPVVLATTLLLLTGFGLGYELGVQRRFLDSVPAALRGQAFGLNSTGLMCGQGASPPVVGALAGALGPGAAMAAAGTATVLAALALRRDLLPGADR
jgi:MFS family permease